MSEETAIVARPENPLRILLGNHCLIIERTDQGGSFRLVSPEGRQPLEVRITESGAVLRIDSGISVVVEGRIEIAADSVSVCTRDDLTLKSGGTATIHAEGLLKTEGDSQRISATLGNVQVHANDDVILEGERVRVNC